MPATETDESFTVDSSGYAPLYSDINAITTLPDARVVRLEPDTEKRAYAQFQDLYYKYSDFDTFVMEFVEGFSYRMVVRPDNLADFDVVGFDLYTPQFAGQSLSSPVAGAFYSDVVTAEFTGDVHVSFFVAAIGLGRPPTTGYSIELITVGTPPPPVFTAKADKITLLAPGKVAALGGNDVVTGSPGADRISGNGGNDTLKGKGGADRIAGNTGKDTISGGARDDVLRGGSGNDVVSGNAGADRIFGGSGNDRLKGGGGSDVIDPGPGRDIVWGGKGGDLFRFRDGDDRTTIRDFRPDTRTEIIDLGRVSDITSYRDLKADHVTETRSGVLIDDGDGLTILLTGLDLSDLVKADFLF